MYPPIPELLDDARLEAMHSQLESMDWEDGNRLKKPGLDSSLRHYSTQTRFPQVDGRPR
jgi:hypothetical protein